MLLWLTRKLRLGGAAASRTALPLWTALALTLILVCLAGAISSCIQAHADPTVAKLVAKFLDVGQADAILTYLPDGTTLLIDAGTRSAKVADILKDMEVKRLDYLVLTHPHEDHIGGAAKVIEEMDVGEIWMPRTSHTSKTYEDLLLAIKAKGMQVSEAKAGEVMIDKDKLNAVFIGPAEISDDLNNMSAVLVITYGDSTFLFTGDAEAESEAAMLKSGSVPRADVLKVGHHGSSTSTSQSMLDQVKPSIGIVQVGAGNSYGHPSPATLDRLTKAGVKVYRTDLNGTVTVESDGNTIKVDAEKDANG